MFSSFLDFDESFSTNSSPVLTYSPGFSLDFSPDFRFGSERKSLMPDEHDELAFNISESFANSIDALPQLIPKHLELIPSTEEFIPLEIAKIVPVPSPKKKKENKSKVSSQPTIMRPFESPMSLELTINMLKSRLSKQPVKKPE